MRKLIGSLVFLFFCAPLFAQMKVNGDRYFYGIVDMSGAKKTVPIRPVATDPATCDSSVYETIFNTTTDQVKFCIAPNTWYAIQGSGGSYTLPVATNSVLGGVKVGSGINVAGDGTLTVTPYSLPIATGSILGGIKAGSGVSIAGDGTLSVAGGGGGSGEYSLGATFPLTMTRVAAPGGVTANTLVMLNAAGQVTGSTLGTRGLGITRAAATSGSNVEVAIGGTTQCLADNTMVIGDIAVGGTSLAGYCRDSGKTSVFGISSNVEIVGKVMSSATVGQLVTIQLVSPGINGANAAVFTGDAGSGGTSGAVPAPPSGSGSTGKFLAAAGDWETPGGAGSSMAAQLGDCEVVRLNGTNLTIGANNSTTSACNVRYGDTVYSISQPATVVLSGNTSGTLYSWVDTTGHIIVGYPSGTSITCTGCTAMQATSFPSGIFELGIATYANGAFDATGVTDFRAVYGRTLLTAGDGITTTTSGTTSQVSIDQTVVPTYSSGSASPDNATCTQIGQLYVQTGASYHYWACNNNGTTMAWYQVDGGSGNPAYTLPVASGTVLGGIKVGSGLSIDGSGVLSASALAPATASTLGVIKVGSGLNILGDGTLSVAAGGGTGDPTVQSTHFCVFECALISGNATGTHTAHQQQANLFNAPYSMVIKHLGFYPNVADSGKGIAVGIADTSGTILSQCTAVAGTGTNPMDCAFTTPLTLSAGTAYYFVWSTDSSTITLKAGGTDVYFYLFSVNNATNSIADQGYTDILFTGTGSGVQLVNFASVTDNVGVVQPWIFAQN